MGHAIPKQHPAVVLRSHYNLVRALLGVAMVALVGLVIALVVVADDDTGSGPTSAVEAAPVVPRGVPLQSLPAYPTPEAPSAGADRSYSGSAPTRKLDGSTDIQRSTAPVAPGTRYDGGPEEGTRGAITAPVAPGTRYDGGPDEGTRSPLTSRVAPDSDGPAESRSGPGFRTD